MVPQQKLALRSTVSAYACYKLTHPLSDHYLYGYIDRNSPEFGRIRDLVGVSKERPAILMLRFQDRNNPQNQVVIDSLVNDTWFKP